jgi:hypothetical protein
MSMLGLILLVTAFAQAPAAQQNGSDLSGGGRSEVIRKADDANRVTWDGKPLDGPPPLTEVEQLRIQNVNLERVIVQRAVDDWQKKQAQLKADLEKARPGWLWDPETGAWKKAETDTKKDSGSSNP